MPDKTVHFRVLGILRNQLLRVDSWQSLRTCLDQLEEALLASVSIEVLAEVRLPVVAVGGQEVFVAIPHTSYLLKLTAVNDSLQEDEHLFAQLAASLLSQTPLFQSV
ncbi:MAG: hypothetical protein KC419_22875, partial [Anaerolineales bacterium]|nr:hypothetical protein [Anaerolineales bacterium]